MLPHVWGLFVVISAFIAKCGPGIGSGALHEQMRLYITAKTEVLLVAVEQLAPQGARFDELQQSLEMAQKSLATLQDSLSTVHGSLEDVQATVHDLQLSIPAWIHEEIYKMSQALAAQLPVTRALSELRQQAGVQAALSALSSLKTGVVQYYATSLVVPVLSSNVHSSLPFGLYLPADAAILGYHITPATLLLLSLVGFVFSAFAIFFVLLLVLKGRLRADPNGAAAMRDLPSPNNRATAPVTASLEDPAENMGTTEDSRLTSDHRMGDSEDGSMNPAETSTLTPPTVLLDTIALSVIYKDAAVADPGQSIEAREDITSALYVLEDSEAGVHVTRPSAEVSNVSMILSQGFLAEETQADEEHKASRNPGSEPSSTLQSIGASGAVSTRQVAGGAGAGLGAPLVEAQAEANTDNAGRAHGPVYGDNIGAAGGGDIAQTPPYFTFPAEDTTVLPEWVMARRRSHANNNPALCLSFRKGQIIRVLAGKPGGRWWIGEVEDGSRGHFPPTCVDVLVGPKTDVVASVPVIVVRPPTPDCTKNPIAQPERHVLRDRVNDGSV